MRAPVAFWDFDGAMRPGMWRACLIEALTAVDPDHLVTAEDVRAGLRGVFPWHRSHEPHAHLGTKSPTPGCFRQHFTAPEIR